MRIFCKLQTVFALVLFALSTTFLSAHAESWPQTVSQLNGWNGIALIKGKRCAACYSLLFPKEFGLRSDVELKILIDIPRKRYSDMAYDLDGPLFSDKDVLSHLMHLALDYNHLKAGKIILNTEAYGMALGVETSERKTGDYVIPLIHGFKDLNALIEPSEYEGIARHICAWSSSQYNFFAANELINDLNARGYQLFATQLSNKCDAEKDLIRKNGEKFFEVK